MYNSRFFKDHFPDFPVLPGVLALEMLKQTAERYLESLVAGEGQSACGSGQGLPGFKNSMEGRHYFLKQIRATRFTKYLRPGDEWESQLRLLQSVGEDTMWDAKLLYHGDVAVSAKLTIAKVKNPQSSIASA